MKKYLSFVVAAFAFLFTSPIQCFSSDTAYYFNEWGDLLYLNHHAIKSTSYVIRTRRQFHDIFHEIQDDTTEVSADYIPATVLSISRRIARKVERLIRRGEIDNPLVTGNIVEVLDKSILRRMYDNIQSRCSSNDSKNFREHGGVLLPDGTITCVTGDLSNPRLFAGATLYVKQEALVYYHSHPCGCVEVSSSGSYAADEEHNPNKVLFSATKTTQLICFIQGPSKQDQDVVGNSTGYVFGMKEGSGLIYIYDREGVKATLPISFVEKVRKSESRKVRKFERPELRKIETYIAGMFPGMQ